MSEQEIMEQPTDKTETHENMEQPTAETVTHESMEQPTAEIATREKSDTQILSSILLELREINNKQGLLIESIANLESVMKASSEKPPFRSFDRSGPRPDRGGPPHRRSFPPRGGRPGGDNRGSGEYRGGGDNRGGGEYRGGGDNRGGENRNPDWKKTSGFGGPRDRGPRK